MELRQECGFPVGQAEGIVTNHDARTECLKKGMETSNHGDETLIYEDKS